MSEDVEALVGDIVQLVAELPDRTSPNDWPEAMLVTRAELAEIVADVVTPLCRENARLQAEAERFFRQ